MAQILIMSNSKSDQTVTGNLEAIKVTSESQSNQQEKSPRGAQDHLQARAILILKINFKKKLTTEKIPK